MPKTGTKKIVRVEMEMPLFEALALAAKADGVRPATFLRTLWAKERRRRERDNS